MNLTDNCFRVQYVLGFFARIFYKNLVIFINLKTISKTQQFFYNESKNFICLLTIIHFQGKTLHTESKRTGTAFLEKLIAPFVSW